MTIPPDLRSKIVALTPHLPPGPKVPARWEVTVETWSPDWSFFATTKFLGATGVRSACLGLTWAHVDEQESEVA